MLQKISTDKAPAAIGPYSQGIVLGNIFFASGQIPIDPATGEIHGTTIEEQAEQVMKNIGELLQAAGHRLHQSSQDSCFLADMGDFAAFNQSMQSTLLRILPEAVLQSRPFPKTYYVKWKSLQKYNADKNA